MRRVIGGVAPLALLLFACPDDDDIGQSGSGASGAGAGPPGAGGGTYMPPECGELGEAFTDPACGECALESCCEELAACDGNAACSDLHECRAACSDSACADACATTHAGGAADADALDACLAGPCAASCPTSPGICDTSLTFGTPECDGCLGDNCCTQLNDCLDDAVCNECVATSSGEGCATNLLYGDVTDCFTTSCSDLCGG
jgi:hypothetical protein